MSNKDRILAASVEVFNALGVAGVSTNHIAKAAAVSPGNLYFHFTDKEDILRQLFRSMVAAVEEAWQPFLEGKVACQPEIFLRQTFEVFWRFRFFHREMYHLRRSDLRLGKMWREHMRYAFRSLATIHAHWVETGILRAPQDEGERDMILTGLLSMSSSFLQIFESRERQATKAAVERGIVFALRFLAPYHLGRHRRQLVQRLKM